ncbi:uncharacterized protein LOC143250813 isoform X5 [Tachypleus tridentatus]|uniref:uncharacterized protein LOC143250813 isoform X5 n=1 Tax=Tachypleus tridentatus TaxID=6853 RepID=UPI003FD017FB
MFNVSIFRSADLISVMDDERNNEVDSIGEKPSSEKGSVDGMEDVSDEESNSESDSERGGASSSGDDDNKQSKSDEESEESDGSDTSRERRKRKQRSIPFKFESSQENTKDKFIQKRICKNYKSVEEISTTVDNETIENIKDCENSFSENSSQDENDDIALNDVKETKDLDENIVKIKSRTRKDENNKAKLSDVHVHAPDGELDFEEEMHEDEQEVDEVINKEIEVEKKEPGEKSEEGEADDDDGEVSDDDDLEEGEVKEGSGGRKAQPRPVCRFFNKGQCTWGTSCRFIHPGINDKGNYNMFAGPKPVPLGPGNIMMAGGGPPPPPPMMGPGPGLGPGPIGPPRMGMMPGPGGPELPPLPPPPLPPPFMEELPPVESAWERGLRHAKELMKKANRRKEQEPDFEEKRLNLSLDVNDRFPDYDKENDVYGRSPSRKLGGEMMYYGGYGNGPENFELMEREARDFWRGRYENFEVRWSRPEFEYRDPREKDRSKNYRRSFEREKPIRMSPERERWRDDRHVEASIPRTRGDEWRDPWRRSKSPKGRRSHSRGRSHRSYSSGSSRSHSSRSSRSSSYSYSHSSSKSSIYSSSRRSPRQHSFSKSRSRSRSPYSSSPPKSRPVFRSGPKRRSPPLRPPVKQQYRPRPSPTYERKKPVSQPQNSVLQPPQPKEGHIKQKSDLPRPTRRTKSRSFSGTSLSRSRSVSRSSSTPSRSRSRTFSRSPSISISSVSSVSSKSSRSSIGSEKPQKQLASYPEKRAEPKPQPEKPAPKVSSREALPKPKEIVKNKEKQPPRKEVSKEKKVEVPVRAYDYTSSAVQKVSKDPLKHIGHKQQIKLTLLNKGPPEKTTTVSKREEIKQKNGEKDNIKATSRTAAGTFQQPSSNRKRPASPLQQATPPKPSSSTTLLDDKKSTSSRREELLKQLKAVEDAIARKRSKLS